MNPHCGVCEDVIANPSWAQKIRIRKSLPVYCSVSCASTSKRIKVKCLFCGTIFSETATKINRGHGKFCSKDCRLKSKRKTKECAFCGKIFTRYASHLSDTGVNYCSKSCAAKALRPLRPSTNVDKSCLFCSKMFKTHRWKGRKGWGLYCSNKCRLYASRTRIEKECPVCGTLFTAELNILKKGNGKYCSRKCWSISYTGEGNPRWKGGRRTLEDRSGKGKSWKKQAAKARKRDKYICQDCGKTQLELRSTLHVHHIIPFWNFTSVRKANLLTNLRSLCGSCHKKAENKIKWHQTLFLERLCA